MSPNVGPQASESDRSRLKTAVLAGSAVAVGLMVVEAVATPPLAGAVLVGAAVVKAAEHFTSPRQQG
jgi:hypothetical protein